MGTFDDLFKTVNMAKNVNNTNYSQFSVPQGTNSVESGEMFVFHIEDIEGLSGNRNKDESTSIFDFEQNNPINQNYGSPSTGMSDVFGTENQYKSNAYSGSTNQHDILRDIFSYLSQLLGQNNTGSNSQAKNKTSKENVVTDEPLQNQKNDPVKRGKEEIIQDTKGKTVNDVRGDNRTIKYVGDNGENTFNIEGNNNKVTIENFGSDDKTVLSGNPEDWEVASRNDGAKGSSITYKNKINGSEVIVCSDEAKRNSDWISQRVQIGTANSGNKR